MNSADRTFINAWNDIGSRRQIAAIFGRSLSWVEERVAALRKRGFNLPDKRTRPRVEAEDTEAELLTLWVAFEYETNAEEIRAPKRYQGNVQGARRTLAVALYELGWSNQRIARWMYHAGAKMLSHSSVIFWRQSASAANVADAMKALGQCGLPFRRQQRALAKQADALARRATMEAA